MPVYFGFVVWTHFHSTEWMNEFIYSTWRVLRVSPFLSRFLQEKERGLITTLLGKRYSAAWWSMVWGPFLFLPRNKSGDQSCWALGRGKRISFCVHTRQAASRVAVASEGDEPEQQKKKKNKACEDQHCMKWGLLTHLFPCFLLLLAVALSGLLNWWRIET